MEDIDAEIKKVAGEITRAVDGQAAALDANDKQYYRDIEKLLRKKEEQLRKKEEQLREERLLQLRQATACE